MDKALYDQIQQIELNHWWYVARRQIIFDTVFDILNRYDNPKIMDCGCGTGFNMAYLGDHGYKHVVGMDFTFMALDYCRQRGLEHVLCADATTPPFASEQFDVILALDIVEHVENDTLMLERMAQALTDDGRLVIFTPAYQFLWSKQDEVSHHFRRYTASNLQQKMEMAGLEIERITYNNTLLFPLVLAGRFFINLFGSDTVSENDLHPSWSNEILKQIYLFERHLLRLMNLPFGVSIMAVAHKKSVVNKTRG